ncbi:uncharacterized protein AMSG_02635, partial [Thecamonas trahens ATCC 50062]
MSSQLRPLPHTQVVSQVDMEGMKTASLRVTDAHAEDEERPTFSDLKQSSSQKQDDSEAEPKFVMGEPIPLPAALLEQYDYLEYKCFMGVFPEINRAWITRDNHIFLWNYNDGAGADFVSYDDLDQVIISAGLCRPKAGVFRDEIQWLLVLATPVDIVIVGMSFEHNSIFGELTLVPTPLTIPSDNVNITHIRGTVDGRIFLTGRDGNLYELEYQEQDGWFTRKCRKLNHSQSPLAPYVPSFLRLWKTLPIVDITIDHSRNILYTLSAALPDEPASSAGASRRSSSTPPVITVWDLGELGNELVRNLHSVIGVEDAIVSIHAIPVTEFTDVHLVAVTRKGIRIYLSTFVFRGNRPVPSARPQTLQVVQVRSAPSAPVPAPRPGADMYRGQYSSFASHNQSGFNHHDYSAGPSANRQTVVHTAYHSHGVFVTASSVDAHKDRVVCVGDAWRKLAVQSYNGKFANSGQTSALEFQGRTWDVAEVPMSILIQRDQISELAPSYAYLTRDASKSLAATASSGAATTNANARKRRQEAGASLSVAQNRTSAGMAAAAASAAVRHPAASGAGASSSATGVGLADAAGSSGSSSLNSLFWSLFGKTASTSATYVPLRSRPNELATQHILPARKFVLLTNQGLNVVIKLRPVDLLKNLLDATRGDLDNPYVVNFSNHYGATEMVAMCLILATSSISSAAPASSLALRAAAPYLDMGSPTRGRTSLARGSLSASAPDSNIVRYATSAIFKFGRTSLAPDTGTSGHEATSSILGGAAAARTVQFSSVHDGLYRYFSRLVKPVWALPLTYRTSTNSTAQSLQLEAPQYAELERQLSTLRAFIADEPRFLDVSAAVESDEPASLVRFQQLLNRTIEAAAFLQVLLRYNLPALTVAIPSELSNRLRQQTFASLVATSEGNVVARGLVTELMRMVAGDETTDEISQVMHRRCPSFFSYGDMLRYKGFELLYKSEQANSARERTELLDTALRHFVKAAATIEDLDSVTDRFRFLRFYTGVLDLALARAQAVDPHDQALQYVLGGVNVQVEQAVKDAFDARFAAYNAVLNTLDELLRPAARANPTLGLAPRPPIDPADLDRARAHFVQRAVASHDELFHITLYRWYIDQGLVNELLSLSSPYLESFLVRYPEHVDMLWNYYIRNSKFRQAAIILARLAEAVDPPVALQTRIQYLVRAIKCASAEATDFTDGEFLHELEEKLEVAQLQSQVLAELEAKNVGAEVGALASRLLDISTLYNEYADLYNLHWSSLAIMHTASGLDDSERSQRVKAIWAAIVDQALPASSTADRAEELARLLVSAGRKYYPQSSVFRIDDLTALLEARSLEVGVPNRLWVVDALIAVGVPVETLFAIYDHHFSARSPPWQTRDGELHLVHILVGIFHRGLDATAHRDDIEKYKAAVGAYGEDSIEVVQLRHQLDQLCSS